MMHEGPLDRAAERPHLTQNRSGDQLRVFTSVPEETPQFTSLDDFLLLLVIGGPYSCKDIQHTIVQLTIGTLYRVSGCCEVVHRSVTATSHAACASFLVSLYEDVSLIDADAGYLDGLPVDDRPIHRHRIDNQADLVDAQ